MDVRRNLLEDKSGTEEAHWGGVGFQRGREERDAHSLMQGTWDPDTSPTPSHSVHKSRHFFIWEKLEVDFYHLMPIESGSIQAYPKLKSGQFYSDAPRSSSISVRNLSNNPVSFARNLGII